MVSRLFGALRRVFVRPPASYYDGVIEEAVRGLESIKQSSSRISAVHDALTKLSPADLARLKSAEELRKLATHAYNGTGTEKNVYLASALWTFAGMKGDVESLYSLAQCIAKGQGYPGEVYGGPNADAAASLLEEVLEQTEHGWSMFALATLLLQRYGFVSEGESSVPLSAWDAGRGGSGGSAGGGGSGGYSVEERERGLRRALDLYRRAAELGVGPACLNVSNVYFTGFGGVERDEKRGLYWLHRAAKLGDPVAMTQLGYRLAKGVGVDADEKKAFRLYERAAASGRPQSLHNLGAAYMTGVGVEKDEARAAEYFRQAAQAGNLASKWNLATLLEQGRGVAQDFDAALRLLREIAAEGYADDVDEAIRQLERRRAGASASVNVAGLHTLFRGATAESATEWNTPGRSAHDTTDRKTSVVGSGAAVASSSAAAAVAADQSAGTPSSKAAPASSDLWELDEERQRKIEAAAKFDMSIDTSGMAEPQRIAEVLQRLSALRTTDPAVIRAFLEKEAAIHGFKLVQSPKPDGKARDDDDDDDPDDADDGRPKRA